MCDNSKSIVEILYDALHAAREEEGIRYSNEREKDALIEAINKAIKCAKNVVK